MKNIPKRIWLQQGENPNFSTIDDFNNLNGVTWEKEKIFETDIEYVRADLYDKLLEENRKLNIKLDKEYSL